MEEVNIEDVGGWKEARGEERSVRVIRAGVSCLGLLALMTAYWLILSVVWR